MLYISDPDEGSGYSYTHDLGIVGMQENLGLSDDQIERKIVDDSDAKATEEAIEAMYFGWVQYYFYNQLGVYGNNSRDG